jgi:hypothetical protein
MTQRREADERGFFPKPPEKLGRCVPSPFRGLWEATVAMAAKLRMVTPKNAMFCQAATEMSDKTEKTTSKLRLFTSNASRIVCHDLKIVGYHRN